jgi:hypothetical protein
VARGRRKSSSALADLESDAANIPPNKDNMKNADTKIGIFILLNRAFQVRFITIVSPS